MCVARFRALQYFIFDRLLLARWAEHFQRSRQVDALLQQRDSIAAAVSEAKAEVGTVFAQHRRSENRYVRIAITPVAFALMLIGFASQTIAHLLRLADCRTAEFRADAAAADAFGAQTTIDALKKASPSCSTIADKSDLWSTHPSIEARIFRLQDTLSTTSTEARILRTYSLQEWLELERSRSE